MEFLYLKNGKKVKCDAVWKGMGDYIWCNKSGNIKGYPSDKVDLVRTFQVQPLFNKKVNKSLASFRQGDWDGVIREASDALILDPENEFAYTNRAAAYIGKGRFKEAIEDCNAAIQINPRYGLAYSNRGFALELLGEPYHASMDYDTGCKLGSGLGCDNYTRLVVEKKKFNVQPIVEKLVDQSLAQFEKEDWDGVISTTTTALAFDPNDAVAYTNRAGAYANKGLFKQALDDANTAVRLNPDFPLAHNNRGFALESMGYEKVALEEYETACKMGSGLACSNQKRLAENK
jgi:tetratricopeptide (TPR) repeat protein